MYLLANKYQEQWLVWIVSNTANSILWFALMLGDISNIVVFLMWLAYLINSIIGYISWRK